MPKKSKAREIKQEYTCSHEIIAPDKLRVKIINLSNGVVKEDTVIVADPVVLSRTNDIIGFPLEELEFGLYKDSVTPKEVIDDAVAEAIEQLRYARENPPAGAAAH